MEKSYSDLHVRLDTETKDKAEKILEELGLTPSGAVNIFYRQVIARDGLPFRVMRFQNPMPDENMMTTEEINAMLKQSEKDYEAGNYSTADEVFTKILGKKYGEL